MRKSHAPNNGVKLRCYARQKNTDHKIRSVFFIITIFNGFLSDKRMRVVNPLIRFPIR